MLEEPVAAKMEFTQMFWGDGVSECELALKEQRAVVMVGSLTMGSS